MAYYYADSGMGSGPMAMPSSSSATQTQILERAELVKRELQGWLDYLDGMTARPEISVEVFSSRSFQLPDHLEAHEVPTYLHALEDTISASQEDIDEMHFDFTQAGHIARRSITSLREARWPQAMSGSVAMAHQHSSDSSRSSGQYSVASHGLSSPTFSSYSTSPSSAYFGQQNECISPRDLQLNNDYADQSHYGYHKTPPSSTACATVASSEPRKSSSSSQKSMPLFACMITGCSSDGKFTRATDLKRHMNTVHNPDQVRFDCEKTWCGRVGSNGFTRMDHYKEHLREMHRVDIPKKDRQSSKRR